MPSSSTALNRLRPLWSRTPIPDGGTRERVTRGVAWNTIGTAFNQGSTFLVNIIVAHLVSPGSFGRYALIQTTLAVVSSIAQLSSGYTATRYVAEFRDRHPERAGRILGLCGALSVTTGTVAAIALLAGSDRLAVVVNEPRFSTGLMIAAAAVFFNVTNGFLMGALSGLEGYSSLGRAGVASGIVYVALCAVGTWLAGINGALAGIVLSAVFQNVLLWTLVVREAHRFGIRFHVSDAGQEAGILFRFSLPAALNGFASLPALWTANAILARQPQGFEQVALFAAANSFRIMVLFLPNILTTVGSSILNNQRGAGNEEQFRKLFWMNVVVGATTIVAGGGVLSVIGRWLLRLFGNEFDAAYPVLLVLMVAALAETLSQAAFVIIQTQERIWLSFFGVAVPCAVALVATTRLLAPSAGALGVAWAYVASAGLAGIVNWLVVWRLGVWSAPRVAIARAAVEAE